MKNSTEKKIDYLQFKIKLQIDLNTLLIFYQFQRNIFTGFLGVEKLYANRGRNFLKCAGNYCYWSGFFGQVFKNPAIKSSFNKISENPYQLPTHLKNHTKKDEKIVQINVSRSLFHIENTEKFKIYLSGKFAFQHDVQIVNEFLSNSYDASSFFVRNFQIVLPCSC
jgi:hypothetical protein